MLGVLWGRAEHLERLRPYRVETNKPVLPGKLRWACSTTPRWPRSRPRFLYLLWLADLAAGPGTASADRAAKFRRVMDSIAAY